MRKIIYTLLSLSVLLWGASCEKHSFTPSYIAEGADFDSPDYYFYATFATMPALYAGLHLLSHDKPSFFYYHRTSTFDPKAFPANATVYPDLLVTDDRALLQEYMKSKICEINQREPEAIFGLYVDDLRCRLGYDWFVEQGIDSSRVKVTMLSDGTATYQYFYDYFNEPGVGERNWKEYAAQVDALNWEYPRTGTRSTPVFESMEWIYYLSTRPNYRLLLQDGNLLETRDPFVQSQIPQMHMISEPPYDMLAALSPEKQAAFLRMAKFDKSRFEGMFDASPKRNLVIIGTNDSNGNYGQKGYVQKVYDQYKDEYDIFFKPHPAFDPVADYEASFPEMTMLPAQMPFEIFVWSLIDKIDTIGGFPSTVYLTVPIDKVKFIFAPDAASLVRPLNLLFAGKNIEWIQ